MALDNAQFMSELSIVDPPGTDPLSEGDDQIRTSKRTQQQSFPNVDKAVTLSADNLNDAALQSGANIFSNSNVFVPAQQFDNNIIFQQQAVPVIQGLRWRTDTTFETIWQWSMDEFDSMLLQRFAAGVFVDNVISFDITNGRPVFANLTTFNAVTRFADGNVTSPSLAFTSEPGTGLFIQQPGVLAWAVAGAQVMRVSAANFRFDVSALGRDASITNPTWAFTNDIGLGMFRSASNEMSFVSNGTIRMNLNPRSMNLGGIPTSNAGLISGDLFESSGFIAIVP